MNRFNFQQRDYDFAAIERAAMELQHRPIDDPEIEQLVRQRLGEE